MSPTNTIDRLRAVNPAREETDRADTPVARAALERILSEPRGARHRPGRRLRTRLPRGGAAVAIALALAGGGGAFAATNPFGWWSSNPNEARFAINPSARVRTPSATTIGCRSGVCLPNGRGQIYTWIDTIQQPGPANVWTRKNFLKAIAKALAGHRLTAAQAARIRRDIGRVPDSFFSEMRVATRYQTFGGGPVDRVPPAGVPEFLICQQVGRALSCRNLNGDEQAPLGAGVYGALPAPNWRAAPRQRPDYGLPPGIHFTRAEYQVLIDLSKSATTSSGGRRIHAERVPTHRS